MDVTYTNVLEGARQYFQGLPAGTGSTASPAYHEGHHRNEIEQNPNERPPSSNYWPQPQEPQRAPPREHTPVQQRPPSHSSDTSRQYLSIESSRANHYQNSYPEQNQFQFSRPHSREAPSNNAHAQYQPHIATSATYHHQPSAPQQARIQTARSQESQIVYHQQTSQPQPYQNYPQSRYYPVHSQPKPMSSSNTVSYPVASNQVYQSTPHQQQQQQQQQQQNAYYKHIYTSQPQPQTSSPSTSIQRHHEIRQQQQQHQPVSAQNEFKTTHNLPPIAALSAVNYHSRNNREPVRNHPSRPRTSSISVPHSSVGHSSVSHSVPHSVPHSSVQYSTSIIQNTSSYSSTANYSDYRTNSQPNASVPNSSYHQYSTITTPSYSSVIMTSAVTHGTFATPHQSSTQYHQPSKHTPSPRNQPLTNHQSNQNIDRNVNGRLAPVLKPKRESPLDLSVKTVRTSADSTLDDAENDARLKYHQPHRPSAMPVHHNYPVHDVQRNIAQRTQSVSAPKVEFRPNFDIRNYPQETQRASVVVPDKAHSSNQRSDRNMYPPPSQPTNMAGRYPTVPIPTAHLNTYGQPKRTESIPRIDLTYNVNEMNRKRPTEQVPPVVPKKISRNDDTAWRQSIDMQIDQKLSNYKQEQQLKFNPASVAKSVVVNGTRPMPTIEHKKEVPQMRQASSYPPYVNYHSQATHNQTYVPSPATHQYPGYANNYPYGYPRANATPQAYPSNKTSAGGADKRIIDKLRISLEVKEQKKLEQSKIHDGTQLLRSDVQHPSTDVTAPIQPKPGLVSRNNVSPFTPASFQETIYKFHMPKAIDSVNYDVDNKNNLDIKPNDHVQTIFSNSTNSEYDGLAALVAARIRTKGELKQGGPIKSQHSYIENQLRSPLKQETSQSSAFSSSSTNTGSPPKMIKERACLIPPRRRLFSRNEEDQGNNNVPLRDKSGLRSSSETSVFDFPDSDSENETERQSLHSMRRDRKTSIKYPTEIKSERPPSPGEDIFSQMCENFVEQLKSGSYKKKGRQRKVPGDIMERKRDIIERKPDITEFSIMSSQVVVKTEPEEPPPETKDQEVPVVEKPESPVKIEEEVVVKVETLETPKKDDLEVSETKKKPARRRSVSASESESVIVADNIVDNDKTSDSPSKLDIPLVARPPKKPSFGDGSDFYPGWEESVYKYKKSLRMPPTLIRVTRPPKFHRLSTSLPDLDPCPISPTHSVTNDNPDSARKLQKIKSEPLDSDADSNCSFNLFSKQSNYDSEGGSSIKSLPNPQKDSILDRLLEKCGNKKRRKFKRKDENPKVIPKPENPIELLPTPSLEVDKEKDKKLATPVIKSETPLLEFRKKTMDVYKDEFIKKSSKLLGMNKFETVVLNSRTRKETRVLKQRATIKEVFGDDRPASAPPVTCVNEIRIKKEVEEPVEIKQEPDVTELEPENTFQSEILDTKLMLKNKLLNKTKIKSEVENEEEDIMKDILIKMDPDNKSGTPSIDDEGSISGKKRSKLRNMRRKFSSGFDYIRKKKKVKKDIVETEVVVKPRKKGFFKSSLDSEQGIQKELKTWVLNKGIGETHLHRAARLGYTDVTAFCLEKMECHPSPKDNAGYTPLHEACSRGHLDIAKLLLMYGANVSESAQGGIRPLHEAVENGFVEIVRLLLSYGADPSLATYAGLTPLTLAKDETTIQLLKDHIDDINGKPGPPWTFPGFLSNSDLEETGYNALDDAPDGDVESVEDEIEFEVSETLLPNLYTLRGESTSERWVLLQDLSNLLKIKSKDALLKQIIPASTSASSTNQKSVLRELKMTDFLQQAHCCQFLNAGEKLNTRASKIALVKYTDRVKELLNVESVVIAAR